MIAPLLMSLLGDLCNAFDEFLFYLSLIIIGYYLVTFTVDFFGDDNHDDVVELQLHSNGVVELQSHSNGMAGLVSCGYSAFANYSQGLDVEYALLEKDLALLEKKLVLLDKEEEDLGLLSEAFESYNSYMGNVCSKDALFVLSRKDELDNVVVEDLARQEHHESYIGVVYSEDAFLLLPDSYKLDVVTKEFTMQEDHEAHIGVTYTEDLFPVLVEEEQDDTVGFC